MYLSKGCKSPPKPVRICPVQLFMISHSSKEKVSRAVWVRWRVFVGQVTRCGASAGLWWPQPAQALTQWVRPKARPPISWSPREREREPPTPASRNHEAAAALSQQYRVSVEGLMTRWTAHRQKYVKVGEHLDPRSWVEASRTRSASTRSKAFKANWAQLLESIHWLCLTSDFV